MTSASLHDKNVRELQELAREAPLRPKKRRAAPLSRGARLHLIDLLSRWSAPGLAIVAGASVYLAIAAGREYPARALAWAAMLLASLWVCRRLRAEFRAGAGLSAHPFRWRASYTSSASVLGVAFACAPILLAPAEAAAAIQLQIIALMLLVSFAAALMHAAHFYTAAAFAVPSAVFAVLAGARAGEPSLIFGALATALLGFAGLSFANQYLEKSASRRHPRTTFMRSRAESYETESWSDIRSSASDAVGV